MGYATLDLEGISSRMQAAIDQYPEYAPTIQGADGDYTIGGKYRVNTRLGICSCPDSRFRGRMGPCKHLIIAWLYEYEEVHREPTPI